MDMTPFHEFLTQLFDQGKIVFRDAPRAIGPRRRPSRSWPAAFETYSLAVAGPRIAFDPEIACAAAEFLRQASWALVNRDERMTDLEKRLKMPGSPLTPSQHLSADLTMRYLPQVLRRARGLDPSDPLVARIANVLRTLAALRSPLRRHRRPPWSRCNSAGIRGSCSCTPSVWSATIDRAGGPIETGRAWDYYELVLQEHGQPRRRRRK